MAEMNRERLDALKAAQKVTRAAGNYGQRTKSMDDLIAAVEELVGALESMASVFGKMKPMPGEPYGRGVAELCDAKRILSRYRSEDHG